MRIKKGQALIEVIIAITIFAMVVSVGFALFDYEVRQITENQQAVRAWAMAQEGIDAVRSIRDRGWASLTPGTYGLTLSGGVWSFQATSDTQTGLSRSVTITDRAANERDVRVDISWTLSGSRPRTTSASTILTNWRSITAGGVYLSGNWANPQTLGSIDLGAGNIGTGIAVRPQLVYMSATASDNKKSDFFVIDVSNLHAPSIASSLNTGPGLAAVAVTGTFAYVANKEDDEQLQIINIAATSSPALVTSFHLPNNSNYATAIAVSGTTVFIGTENSSGPEFFCVDVTNPSSPTVLGTYEVGADVNDIKVSSGRVFIATSKDAQEFMVINAAAPASPTLMASYNATGTGDGVGVFINEQDQRAYLSRAVSAVGTDPELVVLNASNPDTPTYLAALDLGAQINGVFAADTLMFLATDNSNQELKIYDVSNFPTMSYYSGLNFPQVATDFGFYHNVVYVAVRSNDALRIITSQ